MKVRFARLAGLASIAAFGPVALVAIDAAAADGVAEINQTCASETGCFPGDPAGFPVLITAPGSYRLTSNLVMSGTSTAAIQINASRVSVDLGGFTLQGPVTCTGSGPTLACTPTGLVPGIQSSALAHVVSISNGAVTGMGGGGIILNGRQNRIDAVRADSNGGVGIASNQSAVITDSSAQLNDGIGISGSADLVISGSTAQLNRTDGIRVTTNAVLSGNLSLGNGGSGFFGGNGCQVSGNSARDNAGVGIFMSSGAVVRGNAVFSNDGNGISVSSGSLVQANTSVSNGGIGLSLSGGTGGYRENVVSANGGVEVSGGINLGDNLCDGVVCP